MKKQKNYELTERTNVFLSKETKERFWTFCTKNGLLKSRAIDKALWEYLENKENKENDEN